ncbi:Hexosaminidase D [Armadillidium nasatum]|uniref:beta-N-acetylhexosaminidase n=1 Tax=Armadillidium nasatum TaxID=96803 RepID=A0A5N5SPN3_9CRUS|nr:Hexosaminidase D [Armadillidium nasatum]
MFLFKRQNNLFPLLGLCLFSTGVLLYLISSNKKLSPVPGSSGHRKRENPQNEDEELLTQDPLHLAKQREYKKHLLAKIKNSAMKKTEENRKMDHDPIGVMLHNPEAKNGGKPIGAFDMVDTIKGQIKTKDNFGHRIVHFDLKGAPPKMSYLISLLPFLRTIGATGILVEYEDMFPYWGELERLSAHNAYKREEISAFLQEALKNGLEVIPLIQTFGHMEFVLKLKEFISLREVPNYPQVICPTNNKTLPLLKKIIDQMMEVHPGISWIHIGSDEVYNIGECSRCQKYISSSGISKNDLFLRHSVKVAQYIKSSYDIQPIMWDDEFRKTPLKSIIDSGIGKYVEIMIWRYSPGILAGIRNDIWEKYSEVFNGIWVAGAFKGAAQPDSFLTDINERLNNNKEWMDVLNLYKGNIPFRGIVLTGWQRFDHFAVLCELLPQGIPSLAVNLYYIINKKSDHNALLNVGKVLGCDSFLNMDLKYIEYVNHCTFPGYKVYEISQRLYMLKKDVDNMLKTSYVRGWVSDFNIKHKYASPQMVEQGLQDLSMLLFEYRKLATDSSNALGEIYDEYTVHEWIENNLQKTSDQLNSLFRARSELLKQVDWPRRPVLGHNEKEL